LSPLSFKVRGSNENCNDDQKEEEEQQNDDVLLYLCRDYLDLLMQLGHLYLQAKQFKSAREAWLQCLELDYGGISTAGDDLMRMYLDLSRYEAAFRLGQRLLGIARSSSIQKNHDETSSSSVWIQYSTALVAWHLKDEKAAEYLEQAIRFNPFCAYYLAFWNTFDGVMEYTHELDALQQAEEEDDDAPPQSSLEEAIEYCCSNDNEQAKRWIAMGGHVALRDILLQTIQKKHPSLTPTDVDWNARLVKLEQFCQEQEAEAAAANEQQQEDDEKKKADTSSLEANEQQEETASSSSSSANDDDDEDNNSSSNESMPPKVDLAMFVGMFRTAMEMVQEEDPRFAMVV
jgi:tetratricopeptide (TPR) repeat protein